MKPKEKIRKILVDYPDFRERKNKDFLIAQILQKKYPKLLELKTETIKEIIEQSFMLDRYWRKVLQDNPYLRGSDYRERVKKMEYAVREIYKN